MTDTLAYGYSSERTQSELSNEYQYDSDKIQKSLHSFALDESSLSITQVKVDGPVQPCNRPVTGPFGHNPSIYQHFTA